MRKIAFVLIVLGLCFAAALPGLCQVITLDAISATVEIPDSYTILTPGNMENYVQFLQSKGTTVDVMLKSFEAEGILLQAYGKSGDTCLQISALNDLDAQTYFDIDQQTPATRAKYRREHLDGDAYEVLGISYDSAEWKNTTAYGRFLMLKYVQRIGGKVDHRGYARRTIRNGYTITVDYQVFGRSVSGKDNNALNDVMATWRFLRILPMPGTGTGTGTGTATSAGAARQLVITQEPPRQTNGASFTVKGEATPGALISGSIMRMGTAEAIPLNDTADKSGKFSFSVKLPQEGVYIMALTVSINGVDTEDLAFPEITYDKTMLPVSFDTAFPEGLTSDKLVISGTTEKGVLVQCDVNGKDTQKKVGNNGKFSFTVDTSEEGNYSFAITFSKKGLNDQRFTFYATREWSESELRKKVRDEAIKPAHSVLTSKIKGYTGHVMVYTAYVTEITKSGEDWLIYMAFRKVNSVYRDIIVVRTQQEPNFTVDSQMKMYGRCTGMHLDQDDSGEKEYPSFDLLFWDE